MLHSLLSRENGASIKPRAVQSTFTIFPLTFVSNVFVDPATLPGFLQKFVNINPVSLIVTAVRGSMQGSVTPTQIAYVFVSCAVLIAIFAPLTMYLYNHKNAD